DPDLVIRTSGETRTSNFLPWQSAYAEYEFTPTLWPDFTPEELARIVGRFGQRQRLFGGVRSA
ncbi:MAG: undecaprenyl diphosphate synthase family protein, partial [Alphaproteobacteria bacterium]|nr:undecaprenyl diphosphate synthase family protein [Alphaproteobacteria bacterium]